MKSGLIILIFTCACINLQAQVDFITTIAGNDTVGYCCDGGPATRAEFNHPDQLCLDKLGILYIADAGNNRVRKIVLSTGIITTVVGSDSAGFSGDNGPAINAKIRLPDAVCIDTVGNLYIADAGNHRIRKIIMSTGIITTFAGVGTAGNSGDGGLATNAEISVPAGLTIDKFGNLYFGDIESHSVRKISTANIISTIAGNGTLGYSGDNGLATDAQLNTPGDIGIDSSGNVIISDGHAHVIRKVDAITGIIKTIAGNGIASYTGDGGLAIHAEVSYPYGIFITPLNDILIVEGGNGIVRKIDGVTGIISTLVGCGTLGFSGDNGPATDAKLQPDDVFLDSFGTMYIADFSNARIRKVYNPKLAVQTLSYADDILVYPNPMHDELTIEGAEGGIFEIFNLLGQVVYHQYITTNNQLINIASLPESIYVVMVIDKKGNTKTLRLQKE